VTAIPRRARLHPGRIGSGVYPIAATAIVRIRFAAAHRSRATSSTSPSWPRPSTRPTEPSRPGDLPMALMLPLLRWGRRKLTWRSRRHARAEAPRGIPPARGQRETGARSYS